MILQFFLLNCEVVSEPTSPYFAASGEPKGILAVSYLQEKPAKDEGPFYMEERTLIDVIAKFLGEMIELKLAKKIDMSGT